MSKSKKTTPTWQHTELKVKTMWHQSESRCGIHVNTKVKLTWNPSEFAVTSKRNHSQKKSEAWVKCQWSLSDVQVKSKWIEVKSRWSILTVLPWIRPPHPQPPISFGCPTNIRGHSIHHGRHCTVCCASCKWPFSASLINVHWKLSMSRTELSPGQLRLAGGEERMLTDSVF